jgi:hypothetical protein
LPLFLAQLDKRPGAFFGLLLKLGQAIIGGRRLAACGGVRRQRDGGDKQGQSNWKSQHAMPHFQMRSLSGFEIP